MRKLLLLPLLVLLRGIGVNTHYIKIDHNEFRTSGFPRPPLPPPIEQLPPQHLYHSKELTPAELMVDLTNDLAFRILHYHSILNRNNFAFSPSALMSVLVALYEGSAGRSEHELRNVLQLPATNVIRVGYRDIHRRLRTYFFGSDNPLRGLSLNRDNVTITRDYEAILKFYGYDLGMDMVSSTAAPTTSSTSTTTTTTTTMPPPTIAVLNETATTIPTTEAETTASTPISSSTTASTVPPTITATSPSLPDLESESTTIPMPTTPMSTTPISTTPISATSMPTTTTSTEPITTTITDETPLSTTSAATTTAETTTVATIITTTAASTEEETTTTTSGNTEAPNGGGGGSEVGALVSAFVATVEEDVSSNGVGEPLQRLQAARVSRLPPSGKLQAPPLPQTPRANYLPSVRHVVVVNKEKRRQRSKRHLLLSGSGNKDLDANLFVALFDHPTNSGVHQRRAGSTGIYATTAAGGIAHELSNEYAVELQPHAFTAGGGAGFSNIGADIEVKANLNTDVISHVFYLSHQQLIHTTFKVYNAVLYFKYFDHLKMSVLELELDTPDYNLMILLPDYHVDLVAAAASLRLGPTLRMMRKQLTPKWVQAIIPDFQLHGSMFLTNDLQNMGILDIFEPNRADFHPMTNENRIYVKHIEQSINVNIRTRPINQIKRAYGTQTQPIQISVSHPFLFFVIDREIDVAVMTGRILNPQNVRIQ